MELDLQLVWNNATQVRKQNVPFPGFLRVQKTHSV